MSDHQTLNEQVFGDGLPMFPPHLCCCGTSAIGRAAYKRQVASEHAGSAAATRGQAMTQDNEEPSAASAGYVADKPLAWSVMIEGTTVFSVWLDEEEATRERRRLKKLYEGTRHGRIVVVPLYDRHPKKRKK